MIYSQSSTDKEIEEWVKNIILSERDITLSDKEAFDLLDGTGLIHHARAYGEGDTDLGDQILESFDRKQKKGQWQMKTLIWIFLVMLLAGCGYSSQPGAIRGKLNNYPFGHCYPTDRECFSKLQQEK